MSGGIYKKKVDSRVRTLIENGVQKQHRSMIVMIGEKGREQIVNLHYILSKAQVRKEERIGKGKGEKRREKEKEKREERERERGKRENLFFSKNIGCYYW